MGTAPRKEAIIRAFCNAVKNRTNVQRDAYNIYLCYPVSYVLRSFEARKCLWNLTTALFVRNERPSRKFIHAWEYY